MDNDISHGVLQCVMMRPCFHTYNFKAEYSKHHNSSNNTFLIKNVKVRLSFSGYNFQTIQVVNKKLLDKFPLLFHNILERSGMATSFKKDAQDKKRVMFSWLISMFN